MESTQKRSVVFNVAATCTGVSCALLVFALILSVFVTV